VEAYIGCSSAKVLTDLFLLAMLVVSCHAPAMLVVSGFKLAPRPGVFTALDLHKMDVPLVGQELTGVWTLDEG